MFHIFGDLGENFWHRQARDISNAFLQTLGFG